VERHRQQRRRREFRVRGGAVNHRRAGQILGVSRPALGVFFPSVSISHVWRLGVCALGALWLGSASSGVRIEAAPAPQTAAQRSGGAATGQRALFERYCLTCHNERLEERGTVPVAFESLDLSNVSADAKVWEAVVLKMRAGLMPPSGAPRPDKAAHDGFVSLLEASLDRAAAADPNPGRTEPFHRLNRAEYRNAVRDLLDLDIDVSSLLPADDVSYGFDNIAGVLKMSPTLLERYLSAAQKVSRLAVGTPPPVPSIDYVRVPDDLSQDAHLPGLPLGTRGGTLIPYAFPMDAEYEIRVRLARDLNESMPLYTEPQLVEINVDGERVGGFTLPGVGNRGQAPPAPAAVSSTEPARPAISQVQQTIRLSAKDREARNRADENWNLRVPVKAGQRDVVVTFVNRTAALEETVRQPFLRPYPAGVNIAETRQGAHLLSVEIAGPYNPRGAGDSPSRRRIFACASADDACAKTILSRLARRAYRRAVTDADVEPLLAFYREGRAAGFDHGIERAIRRLLVSPEFLVRVERDPAGVAPNRAYRISDRELASRLSFFLWSSIPDDELIDLAEQRQLGDPAVLAAQVKRMLADPRADAFVTNFAGQWLFLRNLPATGPVQSVFPDFDDSLRQAFQKETELFFESIVREDRSAFDLLRADYTFLNERLATHYGIPNVKGSHFRRVALGANHVRSGLLGQGSVLTVTSYPDRTSPVVRGKWILENLLGTPPPPPLPNVGDLKPTGAGGVVLSMRDRMAQHRANPVCASCHSMMDPLGLSLENFDAVGKWRTLGESSTPIDASGVLPDGTKFEGPAGLRDALLRSNRFVATLTEKMMTYALGRGLEHYDAPAVRAVLQAAARDDYRLSSLILGVVQSTPFRMRRAAEMKR
jgi:mono/diheme cytochrome c family protein